MPIRFRFMRQVLGITILIACTSSLASANTILTYTGNKFTNVYDDPLIAGTYETRMFVRATVELSGPLPLRFGGVVPLHWTMSDGRTTISDTCAHCNGHFSLKTDGTSKVYEWQF